MIQIQISGNEKILKLIEKKKKWLLWSGVMLICIGMAAIVFPVAATIAAELFIGVLFIISGLLTLSFSYYYKDNGPISGALIMSLLTFILGLSLLLNPAAGAMALTILIALLFVFDGIVGLYIAYELKPKHGWGWLLASATVSIIAGLLIGIGLPDTSLLVLGLLVGINLIITGLSFVTLARTVKIETIG